MLYPTLFRHAKDRLPVVLILSLTLLDFALYFWVESLWVLAIYFWLMIIPKLNICAWNHHHQHLSTFRYAPLNRLLEFFYALHTGVTTNLWVLHHVLGHHHHFLDQTKDESGWKRKDGKVMGELEYSTKVAFTAYYRGYQVGKTHPKLQRDFVLFGVITLLLVVALVWYRPLQGLFLFVLPMITGLWLTSWVTYEHHAGLDTQNPFEASYNNLHKWYNRLTGNLGYHTAHHYKQGVHWSQLPALHESIKDKIPPHLIKAALA
jgi:fatty acid desaturase